MDLTSVTWFSIAVAVGSCFAAFATWSACRWWYGRKLAAAAQRLRKSDQGRLFSQEQAQLARRQVESLKRELETERAKASSSQSSQKRARELEEALRAAERSAATVLQSAPMPLAPTHGFADTQILS
jgi:sRNA-binding protein